MQRRRISHRSLLYSRLPFFSDTEEQLDGTMRTAKDYAADYVLVGALTLFGNGPADCKTLYYKFLERCSLNLYQNIEACLRFPSNQQENTKKNLKKSPLKFVVSIK